jgi:D-methionine transport system ATP-binding protein
MTDLSELTASGLLATQTAGKIPESIRFERVSHRYRSDGEEVLKDIDFGIRRGEVFGIIGRSGAGKSTLVRTINLVEQPSAGRVLVNGADLSGLGERELAAARRRIGMVFQHFNLLSSRTVAGNIALPLQIAGVPQHEIDRKVDALLQTVGLADKRDCWPAQLSGGQKQRVGIARALVHDPDILLCDEATSALDPETTESILVLLRDINRKLGLTVVLITHEMEVIRQVCDRVAVLEKGKVVELGEVWQVFGAPQADATRALLRAVVHDLPPDLRARLLPVASSAADALLLEVQIDGAAGHSPDLSALTASIGGGALHLVHGAIERIQGRSQGRLVFAAANAGDWLMENGIAQFPLHRIRKLGYLKNGLQHA